ncbi:hypothetical protein [Catenuloplanes atrovinosus]|uniref:Uncharacterized protein n=1 Tax=Catenuloplanes atrovinosus TaxID=137266 RepID=A0AAE4CB04_9ACTN|nr:hypothetical protein [Catenuloplanes atrovinosus]MDR7277603.1 hypothetical protein [Catenuloplanes atrovinosus]
MTSRDMRSFARCWLTARSARPHPDLVFGNVNDRAGRLAHQPRTSGFSSGAIVNSFITHVNATSTSTGLLIPAGHIAPHMFRKTMATLAGTEPSSEIALGIPLKHVAVRALANRSTPGYAATDTSWAALLDTALDHARFTHLHELYDNHHTGPTIGSGPAAERLASTFREIRQTALARHGDARTAHDLLRKARIPLRFGTLNHCLFDDADPAGAKCLENAIVPPGHRGPLIDRCSPAAAPTASSPAHTPPSGEPSAAACSRCWTTPASHPATTPHYNGNSTTSTRSSPRPPDDRVPCHRASPARGDDPPATRPCPPYRRQTHQGKRLP